MQTIHQTPFTRYLRAKKSLDDRSLNRHVYGLLARSLAKLPPQPPLRVLELGAGCGTMITRLVEWGLLRSARYTALDNHVDFLESTRAYLADWAATWDYRLESSSPAHLTLARGDNLIHLNLLQQSLEAYLQDTAARASAQPPDVMIAHAFLDLVDLPTALPGLVDIVRPGGYLYLTHNFDGDTIFEPPFEPDLQEKILQLYHASMDERQVNGQPSGDSRTGRRLLGQLMAAGLPILAAGSSDWVLYPGEQGYHEDELFFLEFILATIAENLAGLPQLPQADLHRWVNNRREMAASNRLVFIAHQLDVLAQKPGGE